MDRQNSDNSKQADGLRLTTNPGHNQNRQIVISSNHPAHKSLAGITFAMAGLNTAALYRAVMEWKRTRDILVAKLTPMIPLYLAFQNQVEGMALQWLKHREFVEKSILSGAVELEKTLTSVNAIADSTFQLRLPSSMAPLPSNLYEHDGTPKYSVHPAIPPIRECPFLSYGRSNEVPCTTVDQLPQGSLTSEFIHGPDYRCIRLRGAVLTLSPREAEIVQMLHELYENGTPDIGQEYIINEICGPESNVKRLRDLFSDKRVWNALVVKGKRSGTFRLNIEASENPDDVN